MYLRAAHVEKHIPSLKQFVKTNSLGILITSISGQESPELQCSHIPWVYDASSNDDDLGVLRGHMARANPQSKSLIEESKRLHSDPATGYFLEKDVLVLFNGPTDHYVTPKFYVSTKPETGKVVPTWNYSAVQAYGKARIYFDNNAKDTDAYLSKQISDLSEQSETDIMGFGQQGGKPTWKVSDAPDNFIALLKKAIIGIEVEVSSLGGKYKMSQELKEEDRAGVISGFEALGTEAGRKIARTVEERSAKRG